MVVSVLRSYVQQYEPDDPKTHAGRNLERMSMRQLYEAFGLQETTIDFVVRARCKTCCLLRSSTAVHESASSQWTQQRPKSPSSALVFLLLSRPLCAEWI